MRNQTQQAPSEIKLFPTGDVCAFPANSTIQQFHLLGGGSWQPVSNENTSLGFNCGSTINTVQIFANGSDFINVQYDPTGSKRGATAILLVYLTSASNVIVNEPTIRNVYTNLVSEVTTMALKEPLPELVRRKILNLNSYSREGNENAESFFVGDGFMTLVRTSGEGNSIVVKTQIYPDKAMKLE